MRVWCIYFLSILSVEREKSLDIEPSIGKKKIHVAPQHMFIQQIRLKHLLHIKHCTRCWRYTDLNPALLEIVFQQLRDFSEDCPITPGGRSDAVRQQCCGFILPCCQECGGREDQPETSCGENYLGQLEKIRRAAPAPLSSSAKQEHKVEVERADLRNS